MSIIYRTWHANDYALLAEGEIDLAMTMMTDSPADFHGRIIGEDRPVCCMSSEHPLTAASQISLDQYLYAAHVTITGGGDKDGFIDTWLKKKNQRREIKLAVPYFTAALRVISQSPYLLTIPEHIAIKLAQDYPIAWRALGFEQFTHRYWMLWHSRHQHSPEQQWFRRLVHSQFQQSQFLSPGQVRPSS
ncbi:LysR substrate-binding domain-containing protein [Pseudomonas silvicola]|nr:LysR substrate-binding domain-containing protein [Pseudomonas silvicola]